MCLFVCCCYEGERKAGWRDRGNKEGKGGRKRAKLKMLWHTKRVEAKKERDWESVRHGELSLEWNADLSNNNQIDLCTSSTDKTFPQPYSMEYMCS